MRNKEKMLKLVEGDMVVVLGISYVVEKNENGALYGVSTNVESLTIEINEALKPDVVITLKELSEWLSPKSITNDSKTLNQFLEFQWQQ
jgi:hypothetical protein